MAAQRSASVAAGTVIGRYQIDAFIGGGGMGEVYAASDTALGRRVALKLLPLDSHADDARLQRFAREARAASALNHPAVVSVHDAGVADGRFFIAMELVDGEPLSRWIRSRHGVAKSIGIMAQVADGLARAHGAGIVHRDLKPDNIMVARGGYAKIVDFGVAKLTEPSERTDGDEADTAPAAMFGTAAYMSPEQVEGRAIDHRSDIFSFGAVLYEVLTGRRAFAADSHVDSMHAVLHSQPPLTSLDPELQRILRRCLAKDREERYQSMRDAALDLGDYARTHHAPRARSSRGLSWLLLTVLLLVAGGIYWTSLDATEAPAAAATPTERLMVRVTNIGTVGAAAMSPDGKLVVYSAQEGDQESLWVKQIATGRTVRINGPSEIQYISVQVSPDGTWVYFTATSRQETNMMNLFQIPLLGGQARQVASDTEGGFTLSPDGRQVAFRRWSAIDREHRLTVASLEDGFEEVVLRRQYPGYIHSMTWSPDGKTIAFVGSLNTNESRGVIFELALDTRRVEAINTTNFGGMHSIAYMPDGSGFLAAAFAPEQPPQVWFIPRKGSNFRKITSDISAYSSMRVAADGKSLIAVRDEPDSNVWIADAANGRNMRPLTDGVGNYLGSAGVCWLGNDKVIYTSMLNGRATLVAMNAAGGEAEPFLGRMTAWEPTASPDGKQIAFMSDHGGPSEVWVAGASGEKPRCVTNDGRTGQPSFAEGGRSLVYTTFGATQFPWKVDLATGKRQQLMNRPSNRAMLSPDGKWFLARLRSTEPGVPLWRTTLMPAGEPDKARVFDVPRYAGRVELRWLPDSRSFSFVDWKDGVANVWVQSIEGGEPRQATFFDAGKIFSHDWSPDGTRIVLARGMPLSDVVLIRDFQ